MSGGKETEVDGATGDSATAVDTKVDNATGDCTTGDDTRADGGRDGTDVRWVITPHDRARRPPKAATGPQATSLTRTGIIWHTVASVAVSLFIGWTRTTRRPRVSDTLAAFLWVCLLPCPCIITYLQNVSRIVATLFIANSKHVCPQLRIEHNMVSSVTYKGEEPWRKVYNRAW